MSEAVNIKTRAITRKKVLKDGTVREYKSTTTYKVKGHINADGTVSQFTEEQKAEMRRLRSIGVSKTRLMKDYNAAMNTITKIVGK